MYSFIYCRCPAAGGRHKSKSQHACTNHACFFFIERLCDLFLHSWDGMYMLCLDTQVSGCAQSCHKNFTFGQIPCHIISLLGSASFALITEPALSDFRQYHPLPRPDLTSFSHPTRSGSPFPLRSMQLHGFRNRSLKPHIRHLAQAEVPSHRDGAGLASFVFLLSHVHPASCICHSQFRNNPEKYHRGDDTIL